LYPSGKIVIILDNSRIHHAKLLESFFKENNNRLQLKFLPPYSPKMNLIEGLWGWLKSEVINNVFFSSISEIRKAVRGFVNSIIKVPEMVINRLCVGM
jgi:putative transposase